MTYDKDVQQEEEVGCSVSSDPVTEAQNIQSALSDVSVYGERVPTTAKGPRTRYWLAPVTFNGTI
jgi:hypothetical protein